MSWSDLREIVIVATDDGPYVEDIWWFLVGEECGCLVPNSHIAADGLMSRLMALPGFRGDQVIRAMSGFERGTFRCWRLPSAGLADNP